MLEQRSPQPFKRRRSAARGGQWRGVDRRQSDVCGHLVGSARGGLVRSCSLLPQSYSKLGVYQKSSRRFMGKTSRVGKASRKPKKAHQPRPKFPTSARTWSRGDGSISSEEVRGEARGLGDCHVYFVERPWSANPLKKGVKGCH